MRISGEGVKRNRYGKRIIAAVLAGTLLITCGSVVLAAPKSKKEPDFRLTQAGKTYALARRAEVFIYEEMDEDSKRVGRIETYGVFHVLQEEEDGWYFIESGNVRGFVKEKHVRTGDSVDRYVKKNREENLETAEALVEPIENEAFLYTRTTAYETIIDKVYAYTAADTEILDRIPEEVDPDAEEDEFEDIETEETEEAEEDTEEFEAETSETESEETEADTETDMEDTEAESDEDISEDEEDSETEEQSEEEPEEPIVVGKLGQGGLCFVIEDEVDDENWVFIESGDVRGFVPLEALVTEDAEEEIKELGEEDMLVAEQLVKPSENRACYYTYSSVREPQEETEEETEDGKSAEPNYENSEPAPIRQAIVQYAEQFVGNAYVWGGTSLTQGADCSGFVQTIYRDFGYEIPRVAEDQAKVGTKISVEEAMPGDLIFYEKNNYIYHVVMCAGNGETIEAQSSATGIVRTGINWDRAVWAVRIITEEDEETLIDFPQVKEEPVEEVTYGEFLGNFKLTAYCACPICCGVWSGGPTASGVMPQEGRTVAMAGLDFGTRLIIDGQVYTVEDRGTPYGHVDIYMQDHSAAKVFGVGYADVYLAE